MSSTIIISLITIGFVMLVLFIITLFLPSAWTIEEQTIIAASPAAVFPYINESRRWRSWSMWNKKQDATIELTYNDIEKGLGAVQQWTSLQASGTLTIVQSNDDESIQYHLDIDKQNFIVYGQILLAPIDQATNVIWTSRSEFNSFNPLRRLQSAALRRMLSYQMKAGLLQLSELVK